MAYGSTEVRATDFAITTVNVPDRLDLRDMDDRKQLEEDSRQRGIDMAAFRAWAPRLFLIGILTVIAFVIFEGVDTLRTALSPEQISQRLSVSLGVPVQIENSHLTMAPSPRLVLSKVNIDHKVTLDQVSFNLGTRHIAQVFQGRGWNWGEAVVAPMSMSLEQGQDLLNLLPKLHDALPRSLSTVRFEKLEIADQPWLAGAWDVSLVRGPDGGFSGIQATQHKDKGQLEIDVSPTDNPDIVKFDLTGSNWELPFGPSFALDDVIASGAATAGEVSVEKFQVGGPFGAIHGAIKAKFDTAWAIEGSAESEGVDIDALLRQIAPPPAPADDAAGPPSSMFQGMASFTGRLAGKGKTLPEAAAVAVFEAPVHVRSPVLNGIDLGYAATNPGAKSGSGGGSTRFTTLDALVVSNANEVSVRDIRAHAGALAGFGQINVLPGHKLSGLLHVDLGTTRVLAPIRVIVHGNLLKPEFGR